VAAFGVLADGDDDDPPLPQPHIVKPTTSKKKTPENVPSLPERKPSSPTNSSPARAKLACVVCKVDSGGMSFREATGVVPMDLRLLPRVPVTAALVHAEALVWMVSVAVTVLLPETVASGKEKHAFEIEGLLETLHAMVPV